MADFSSVSDTDESAIKELISQAQDLSVLEQISAINCSSFTTLPADLDARFRKLKSFPLPSPKSTSQSSFTSNRSKNVTFSTGIQTPGEKEDPKLSDHVFFSPSNPNPIENADSKQSDHPFFSLPKQKPDEKNVSKPKSGSIVSPANSYNSSPESSEFKVSKKNIEENVFLSSPPAKQGCFFCSPKMKSRSKEKRNKDEDDEIFSGLTKEQKRIIQKAIKEEEKISKEVDKIVKWAKQASTRMKDFDIEDHHQLSDDDFDIEDHHQLSDDDFDVIFK